MPQLTLNEHVGLGLSGNTLLKENVETEGKEGHFPFSESEEAESTLSIVVVGASGHLARKKIFPALFALFYDGRLPKVRPDAISL